MSTTSQPFENQLKQTASATDLGRKVFGLLAVTKSFVFLLLLLSSSVAAAVDSLEPLEENITQKATFFQHNCLVDSSSVFPAAVNSSVHQSPIGLQVSEEPTHQLITRIFAIILKEILHYENVTIVPIEFPDIQRRTDYETQKFVAIRNQLGEHEKYQQMSMINLGFWVPLKLLYKTSPDIYDAGLSMTLGRFGWFVPEQQFENVSKPVKSISYDIFQNPQHPDYKTFIIEEGVLQALCADTKCEHFKNPKCKNVQCVTVLAGHRRNTVFVENHILISGSYVNVLYLGAKFKAKIRNLYKSYNENETYFGSSFIVVHWIPSDVIDNNEYTSIEMPRCENSTALWEDGCKYELTPILKYFSKTLDTDANFRLMNALREFYISTPEQKSMYNDLEQQFRDRPAASYDDMYNSVACNWLKNNTDIYNKWIIPEPVMKLSIGGIFPLNDYSRGHQNVANAAALAVSAIRSRAILKNYDFNVLVNDGECRADVVMKTFIHYFNIPSVMGVLGPACSETAEPIAGISKHTNMPVISYSAEGASISDENMYPYFFRTIGSNRQYEDVYIHLMEKFGWHRVAALTEDGQKYTEYISHMETNMTKRNMELIINKKFLKDVTATQMNQYLTDLKQRRAKVIIADIHNRNAELALCEAYKLGMTAKEDYVWFLPPWISKDWKALAKRNNGTCSIEELQSAYEGHFSLSHTPFGNLSSIMQEGITIGEWLKVFESQNGAISDYIGYTYDAVWAYAKAANKLLQENKDAMNNFRSKSVVESFVKKIWETDFEGVSGRVRFGKGGSRISDIIIKQWQKSEFVTVGNFYPKVKGRGKELDLDGGELLVADEKIMWPTGRVPGDGTYDCSMSGLAEFMSVDCDTAAVVLTAMLCFLAVILISSVSFLFWKRRYDKKLKQSAKIMKTFGIDLLSPSRNKLNTLDKWEIPKENVVVNRRLGEGAFGTVYGGEAQLKSEGWTAVAVKTLKAGASTEDRLDFLSEAEAMKRLDHENIVKLLGVCLQSEPIYTVMEFMLYGDLKTYLLARRHMVNDKTSDESDICPKRLTMYAMDVARGLAYLAEQKYVHRDLACRNCLVNTQRVVKLGDFGMARPTFESDYYRFNRKGMLPVRWMAPESLALGMFTPASDVWAFGVVVFEIITFGSFPFQGMTNNQVLEFVKSGKTLQVPVDAKPQLTELLKDCWNQDPRKRPTAVNIIQSISNHPRLLTPCLDYPGAAVEMPETESDEFELLPKARKCSPTKRDSTLDILAPTSSVSNFERTRALIDSMELSERSVHIELPLNEINNELTVNIDTFSPITPDGYSIMSPLLTHQRSDSLEVQPAGF